MYPEFGGIEGKKDLAFQLIMNKQREKLKFCLDIGFLPMDLKIEHGNILGRIIQHASLDCLEVFLEFPGVDVMNIGEKDAMYGDEFSTNSLIYALRKANLGGNVEQRNNKLAIFKKLVNDPRVDVNRRDEYTKELPIHCAALVKDSRYLHVLLMHQFINVNAVTKTGQSALSIAIRNGKIKNAKLLCEHKYGKIKSTVVIAMLLLCLMFIFLIHEL